jgi:hypothetical protein
MRGLVALETRGRKRAVALENIFRLRPHRLQIEVGDVRFHHVGQEQVGKK